MVTVLITTHLWLHWAKLAIRQERRAWDARKLGQEEEKQGGNYALYLGLETEESIQAVSAARHSLHNLYRVWRPFLSNKKEKAIKADDLTNATSPKDVEQWGQRVLGLIADRVEAVHHDERAASPLPHPGYPSHVSIVAARYTADRATEAVDILMEDVLRPVLTAPAKALESFAEQYSSVLAHLDAQRKKGVDPW